MSTILDQLQHLAGNDNAIVKYTASRAVEIANQLKAGQITPADYNDLMVDLKNNLALLTLAQDLELKNQLGHLLDQAINLGTTLFSL